MIDPRISLAARAPDISQASDIFQNALTAGHNRQVAQAQNQRAEALAPFKLQQAQDQGVINQQTINENRDTQRLTNLHQTGQRLKPLLLAGDNKGAQLFLLNNISAIQSRIEQGSGEDVTESMETLAKLQAGDVKGAIGDIDAIAGLVSTAGQKQFALQSNAPIVDPITGQVSTPVFNPATGQTSLVPIEGAIQNTPTQTAELEFQTASDLSKLSVGETKAKETIKAAVSRTSVLKKEFSERRRLAARSTRKVKEAQALAKNATQGLTGAGKLALSRVFPGIDASDEGALSSAFKSLALDELQKFSGPTTDFEFAVTEDIAGSLGNSASANRARLASLERANWFADRESQQFNDHIKAGHDPDEFFFNFNELVTPKKGGKSYSLQSLQDTAVANHISIDEVIKRLR
tara:strand:+ start:70 stop:1287 length:1218 start_codon:yes stop_codon:yes gene_type:complete